MKQRLIIACMVLLVSPGLYADRFIVNTGPGPAGLPGYSLGGLQWLAVEFDVTEPVTITRVEGWILAYRAGALDVSLYSDGGEVPGELLFRSTGFVETGDGTAEWHGASAVNWTIPPGSYWIAFEPRPGEAVFRMEGAAPYPSKRPLQNGAVADLEWDETYFESDAVAQIGLRIFGDK